MCSSYVKFNVFMMGAVFLTTAGHEAIDLIWTQIVEVAHKAPSAQILGCRAFIHWLDDFRICHVSVVARAR